ncbi:nickel pincer cofactor biosynthesis protein LarB [Tropicimonas sp. IMCC34011]|uniref:nickel pincer cofactor biosynthesis protein LarB n=1 Tax=Tropicimonas sp. IMCC34011 TaxID=2248759 RepID=UPI000E274550|nr:nickel pincer cofactor biosynthesis protein LarB [Tropicimonas sp. IMCC34011]
MTDRVDPDHRLDWAREARTGLPEAILADGKTSGQLDAIVQTVIAEGRRMLMTRLGADEAARLTSNFRHGVVFHPASMTAVIGLQDIPPAQPGPPVAIVTAGTSDLTVAEEARATLHFAGVPGGIVADVGVAGLWRLLDVVDELRKAPVVIAVAGMEGALFSVLAGLVPAPLIAVPTSKGYGVAAGGQAALSSALATCAPGVTCVNIDNGFGAACAAIKMLALRGPRRDELARDRQV